MSKEKGLVIIHVDGLGERYLRQALEQGKMPFVRGLVEEQGYEILPYRCGLPSTTPFVQAGILYGDNSEIPSFRWWDKESGLLISFGGRSAFPHVAHKYFRGCEPLTEGGACIATCYPGGAEESFGLGYEEHGTMVRRNPHALRELLASWAVNPVHLARWLWKGALQVVKTTLEYYQARIEGRRAANRYVISDMLEEIFLHQLTLYATIQAMARNYPTIYAAFYAYDETAHAYGPGAPNSLEILQNVDDTIRHIARRTSAQEREYEMVVLSDHGQVESIPFPEVAGRRLGEMVAEWLPAYAVEEYLGRKFTPKEAIDGHVVLTYSGGLAHLYFKDISWRLERSEIDARFPRLLDKLVHAEGVAFAMVREGPCDRIITPDGEFELGAGSGLEASVRDFLGQYDDPDILAAQLHKLNSFERAGDIVIFGAYQDHHQVNFEDQVGGHGSVGGEQLHPFVLARRELGLELSRVQTAADLHTVLRQLRDRLVTAQPPAPLAPGR